MLITKVNNIKYNQEYINKFKALRTATIQIAGDTPSIFPVQILISAYATNAIAIPLLIKYEFKMVY